MYIKGINNTVADDVSRLDYNPVRVRYADEEEEKLSKKTKWNNFLTLLNR